jgi:hypothetical protein
LHRFLCTKGDVTHGCKVREKSAGQSREGDARTEEGHAQKRKLGQKGNQPQTSHCHRTLGSAPRRRQGAVEEIVKEVVEEIVIQEIDFEEIQLEEVVFEKVYEVLEEEVAPFNCDPAVR